MENKHPTVTVEDQEMELIEFHRAKQALEQKIEEQEIRVDRIKEDPKADIHDHGRELDILKGALEVFENVYENLEEEYGKYSYREMVT